MQRRRYRSRETCTGPGRQAPLQDVRQNVGEWWRVSGEVHFLLHFYEASLYGSGLLIYIEGALGLVLYGVAEWHDEHFIADVDLQMNSLVRVSCTYGNLGQACAR